MKKLLIALALIIPFCSFTQLSDIRFNRLSIEDGLSQVCVNSILQDSQGFIWFATQDGLNKYDGYSFRIYKPNSAEKNSLSNNIVKVLYEDKSGHIWIGTAGGGLNRFNPDDESFASYVFDPFDKSTLSNNDVYAIFEDSDSILWVGTYGGGLNKFDKKTGTFERYQHIQQEPNSIGGNLIRAITEDKNGNLWVGIDEGGLDMFNKGTRTFKHFRHNPSDSSSLSNDIVMDIHVDNDNVMWIGTYGGGLNRFDIYSGRFEAFRKAVGVNSIASDIVWSVYEDSLNRLWIGTREGGISILDKKTKKFVNYKNSPTNHHSISGNNVLSIIEDESGIFWFGTESGGVNYFDSRRKPFHILKYEQNNSNSLSSNNVYTIYQNGDNRLWVGTRGGGLNIIDLKTGENTRIMSSPQDEFNINSIISFAHGAEGEKWIGTDGYGFYQYKDGEGIIENYRFDPKVKNSLSNNAVSSLYVDKDSILWIGTYGGGLNKFDIERNRFRNYKIDHLNFMRNVVLCIFEDSKGILWVGTQGRGLMRLDKSNDRYIYFENERNNPFSISNNVVHAIHEDSYGNLWVGSGGGGLNLFDRETGHFENFGVEEGLANEYILGILEDDSGNLWLSTYNGIAKFNIENKTFYNYFESDGLQGNIFNERSFWKNKDGNMFFGGKNGITYFHPDSIKLSNYQPNVVITDLKIFNQSVFPGDIVKGEKVLKKPIVQTSSIELSHKLAVFSFEFSSLHYSAPRNNKFKYKMYPFEKEWNETDASKRFASYTSLPGGEYILMVKASNSDGVYSDKVKELKITIIPPFYKTSWFYSLLIILLLIVIYTFIKARESQLIKDKNRLEDQVRDRTQEINQQKEELQLQSELLAKNNDELTRNNLLITDSISYAKRIQDAMLPRIEDIRTHLPDSFVFFRPRNIVSGDFYWFYERDEMLYIAVADCTGHGVPGAFMSMIGSTLLNEIIIEKKEFEPTEILSKLNTGVVKALNQTKENTESQDDGMDIAICKIDRNRKKIDFASANHTIYIVRNAELEALQGDIFSIGGMFAGRTHTYTKFSLDIEAGMQVFMLSDGFQDQFGGEKNKKFLASRIKKMLVEISPEKAQIKEKLVAETFDDWKGANKQVDDVIILGFSL